MPDPLQTRDQLIAQAPDNTMRLITPGWARSFINSAFGAVYSFDPTPQDDADNTAGNGAFDAGSVWLTITALTKTVWRCFSGSHNAADWRQIWPPPPAPPTFSIPAAQFRIVAGTTLFGTYMFGIFPLSVGDRLLTWDGIDQSTWGVWVVQTGAWTRAPEMPAGTVFTGPAYVWIASDEEFFPAYPALFTLQPLPWGPGTNPTTWTLGTDHVVCCFASPTSIVTATDPIHETRVYGREGPAQYNLTWVGPTTLDGWATSGGPLSVTNINSGALPSGITLNVAQLTVGIWPVSVFVPYTQISGAPPPGPGVDSGNVTAAATVSYSTVMDLTAATGIVGSANLRCPAHPGESIAWRITVIDAAGNTATSFAVLNEGDPPVYWDFSQPGGFTPGGVIPPFTDFKVEVARNVGTPTYHIIWFSVHD